MFVLLSVFVSMGVFVSISVLVSSRKRLTAYPQTIPFVIFITISSAKQRPLSDMP